MSQTPDRPKSSAALTEKQVADFLRATPDFLSRHPDLLSTLDAPARQSWETADGQHAQSHNIADFQAAMIQRLRREKEDATDVAQELIYNSRDNLTTTKRIHDAVLTLLGAESFERLIDAIHEDLARLLDMDAVCLCLEGDATQGFGVQSVNMLPIGTVDQRLGAGRPHQLSDHITGEPLFFGEAASLVHSQALVRLEISAESPAALLAFGSRDPDTFHPGQATELIGFLSQTVSQLIRIWLGLHP